MLDGVARPDKRAPGGFEIAAEAISIIGLADVFPIAKDKSEEFIRDMRHLWLRSRKMNLVMKVRGKVLEYTREYFKKTRLHRSFAAHVHIRSSGRRLHTVWA